MKFSVKADVWGTEMEDVKRNCFCKSGQNLVVRLFIIQCIVPEGVLLNLIEL